MFVYELISSGFESNCSHYVCAVLLSFVHHVALFLIYLIDLDRKVKINAKVFANDTFALSTFANLKTSANTLNN